ncbi:MAG: hypothetical protein ISR43_03425 [Acidimicrobiia bacterium]|nr:hypothetical protein [Actinomycetota bacterium]MBL6924811.1 hypothetical protein [Acidimicrobiia bacterium]MBL6926263.1 hypothetical protein [Acidimicrobiia bacterium]
MNRRSATVIITLMTLGIGLLVAAALIETDNGGDVTVDSNPAIVRLLPPRGDEVIHQATVGVVLSPGWSGELVQIGGTVIPLDQQQIQDALNSVLYRPGAGLALETLPPQDVCATARYWPVQSPDRTASIDWCFRVNG